MMENSRTSPTTQVFRGLHHTCHIMWSTMSDGPMNIVGREFPPEAPGLPFSKEAGDKERLANRTCFFSQHGLRVNDVCIPKMSHSSKVKYAGEVNTYLEDLQCDGILTDRRGLALSVGFADCPSVVIWDVDKPHLVVLHAGWKGIAAGIVENAIDMLMYRFGSHAVDLRAFIGPSIRECCYEVAPEVATQVDGKAHYGHLKIDLPTIISERLFECAGLKPTILPGCSKCAVDSKTGKPLYFSYRRDHKTDPTENQMLVAVLK